MFGRVGTRAGQARKLVSLDLEGRIRAGGSRLEWMSNELFMRLSRPSERAAGKRMSYFPLYLLHSVSLPISSRFHYSLTINLLHATIECVNGLLKMIIESLSSDQRAPSRHGWQKHVCSLNQSFTRLNVFSWHLWADRWHLKCHMMMLMDGESTK